MILAEFVIDHPVLGEALHRVPGIEIEWEETYSHPDGPIQILIWITSDDFEAVEAAIDADAAVENPTTLIDLSERRLYRVDLTDLGRETHLMPEFIEVGGVLKEAVGTNDGWRCQVQFPDRTGLQHIYRFCRAQEIEFEFQRIFEVAAEEAGENPPLSTLTPGQREALMRACERGYFDVPRQITLLELADELGISDTAVSQRLRRAHSTVCESLFGDTTR